MKRTKDDADPAETVESARNELEKAEKQLAGLDVHDGTVEAVVRHRRELFEAVEVCRERLEVAQARADEIAFAETEKRIEELTEQAVEVESEIEAERERVAKELRRYFNGDWMDGTGRFASCRPEGPGLVSLSSPVQERVERRIEIENQIRRLQSSIAERRAERDRERRAELVEARRALLRGESVCIALEAWRIVPHIGHTSELAGAFALRAIPAAILPADDRLIHALLPSGSTPGQFADSATIQHAAKMDPDELTPAMREVFERSRG